MELPVGEWPERPITLLTGKEQETALVDGFAAPIVAGDKPAVSGENGRAVLVIILVAYQSVAERHPITLAAQGEHAAMAMVAV